MQKINCTSPSHRDQTPSMSVYNDGAWCFSCGWLDRSITDLDAPPREIENIEEKLRYIDGLPRAEIRGLELHFDNRGYFIVWPNGLYYKQRLTGASCRYLGPKGHRAPLMEIPGAGKFVVIVEGELNALSLSKAIKNTIVSPGSATEMSRHLNQYLTLGKDFVIVVDRDPAGVAAGIYLKKELLKRGKRVELVAVTPDYNETLQKEGKDGVFKQFKEDLGLS